MMRRLLPIADGAVDLIETGGGDRTIILVHGTASSPRAMGKLAGLLAVDGFRVLAPAMIGYGDSVMNGDDGVVARNARLLSGLRATLGGEVAVIGHSMGGLVVLRALRAGLSVGGVALYEPVAFGVLDPSDPAQRAARAWDAGVVADMTASITAGDHAAGVRGFIEAWNGQAWTDIPAPVRAALVANAAVLLADVTAIAADLADATVYRGINVKSLIMSGAASPPTARMVCNLLAAALARGVQVTLDAVGHMAPVQHPDVVAVAVLEFLSR
jgi:pimeloyl-ACP methyl ester carboxylesterase